MVSSVLGRVSARERNLLVGKCRPGNDKPHRCGPAKRLPEHDRLPVPQPDLLVTRELALLQKHEKHAAR
ncbi:MAG: hypothetical protein CMJ65_11315 [Planctomycetaceae bacterium]|jgi:hypothetical protein|nr:hypothetical protein [Planctomycetaceae bacterium]